MQPYFFPYLGYFDLIRRTDRWIVFDTVQYMRHGWMNRNRILHPTNGWQYIIVPLRKHPLQTSIRDILTNDDIPWRNRILGQLAHYRKRAPHFAAVTRLVEDGLADGEDRLSRLNTRLLDRVCTYLGIPFPFSYFSEMKLDLPAIQSPGEWALRIAQQLGAGEYVNPSGGEHLFNRDAFARSGIRLTIRHLPPMTYRCGGLVFQPDLSIIDVLMWNTSQQVLAFLDASASLESGEAL